MGAVPDSRLLLKSSRRVNAGAWERVRALFAEQGVDWDRIEIMDSAESKKRHLRLYDHLDIALDTYPYHGTTTTCEALWMGVPVITLAGDRHVSRVSASLLTRVGLSDLIARTPERYVTLGKELAGDRARLARLHGSLRERMESSALRDENGQTRMVESAFRTMWRRWCEGRPTAGFTVGIDAQ